MDARLLVVEDDVIVANNLRDRLRGLGYTVCGIVFSGEEAIERVTEAHPDLVLMDIKLEGEVDGVAAAQELRVRFNTPVVYLTGYADEATLQRAKLSEPYGYILKPFEIRELHSTIEMALYKHAMEQRLKESEHKYRTLVEHSLQGIMIIQGAPPRVVFANAPCADITGYSVDELTGLPPEDTLALVLREDRERLLDRLADHLGGKPVPATGEFRVVSKDGTLRWVEYYASLIESTEQSAIQVTFIDITGRKRAEEKLQRAHDELERRVEDRTAELARTNALLQTEIAARIEIEMALQQRLKELEALNTLGWQVSGSLSLDEVVEAALRGVIDSLDPDLAMLFLRQDEELILQDVYPKHSEWRLDASDTHRIGMCLCGLAVSRREPVYSIEMHADSRCPLEKCQAVGMRSFAALPLLKGADVLGVVGLASRAQRDFAEQAAFLRALSGNVSIGLQNALLHREAQLHAANLERHVAQLRQTEEALRESEKRYRLLFERNLAGVYRSTVDGRFLECNEAFARILGYSTCEEILTIPVLDTYWNSADRERFIAHLQEQGSLTTLEWCLRRKDGSPVWCLENASLVEGQAGAPGEIQGTIVDITKRRRIEQALEKSEERFRNLFENAPLCVFEIDISQTPHAIVQSNRQTEEVYGWSSAEFTALPVQEIFAADDKPDHRRLPNAIRKGDVTTLESTHQRKDGSPFPVRISAAPASTADTSRVILVVEDMTAERSRRSEEEAIVEERRRIAREIHDGLAQNLASLRLQARLWHDLIDQDPRRMHAEVDAMRELLKEQIREVRRSIFALRPVALDELGFHLALRQFVDDLGEQNQLYVELSVLGPQDHLPSALEPVLFRIVQEAMNNIRKHARARTAWIELDLGDVDFLVLVIRDDGIGFNPATLDEAARLGHLGLRQMRERVEELEGRLLLESQLDKGTEIRVVLPTS
jgi:PAS domain S-box-containing protein